MRKIKTSKYFSVSKNLKTKPYTQKSRISDQTQFNLLKKYFKISDHPWYKQVMQLDLTDNDRDWLLKFIHAHSDVKQKQLLKKVSVLFIDQPNRPDNYPIIQEILLVCAQGGF